MTTTKIIEGFESTGKSFHVYGLTKQDSITKFVETTGSKPRTVKSIKMLILKALLTTTETIKKDV